MKVIFKYGSLTIEQESGNGTVNIVTELGRGAFVTQQLPVAKAMEMTAAINTTAFPFSKTART